MTASLKGSLKLITAGLTELSLAPLSVALGTGAIVSLRASRPAGPEDLPQPARLAHARLPTITNFRSRSFQVAICLLRLACNDFAGGRENSRIGKCGQVESRPVLFRFRKIDRGNGCRGPIF